MDKNALKKSFKRIAIVVGKKQIGEFLNFFRSDLVEFRKVKLVREIRGDDENKMIVLRHCSLDSLEDSKKEKIVQCGISSLEVSVEIGYEQMNAQEVFKEVLPESMSVRSFEQVGHIAHLNLSEEHEKYKYIIAEVLIDKNPSVKTVVSKVGKIENKFRVLPFELIGGEKNYFVDTNEHGVRFQFDYSKVYWNSRLANEHQRIVNMILSEKEVIFDMFAGVGPFVVPISKKVGCTCYGNDLNPESYKYLVHNVKLNNVEKKVLCFNMDGREFIMNMIEKKVFPDHVIMNLPATSLDFLPVFRRSFPPDCEKFPIFHCYTFFVVKEGIDPISELKLIVGDIFSSKEISFLNIHPVRDVSNRKKMFCVSFKLPKEVMCRKKRKLEEDQIPNKKAKTSDDIEND